MGVHGLWELLAPVGRRVSVETLAGKRLAIDASIWIIQFMKAMRDEKGEMVRNAHILGFFRRICKLLYLRTKPVFVFDGGTPALKRRTVIARRRQRENAQAKIRKTAEKLLLNHLKQMRLKELAADLEKQRQDNDVKGKRPIIEVPSNEKETDEKGDFNVAVNYNQEELDQMLAASLAAEENEGFTRDGSTSGVGFIDDDGGVFGDEEEDDEDEEMILPEMHGKVDPAVLAALPPSMQLDLLVQMRERLMAENRQKYQKVKKAPSRFSELQIESYLKTVAFRREIDGVRKSAVGSGIGGVQTSRIASEANREFIFSTSFTGDKQTLTSVGQERSEADQSRLPPANCSTGAVSEVLSSRRSDGAAGPAAAESGKKAFHEDVETYMDERGRLRVSRVRALGIRMTRDLQRNLDLMKEIDREKTDMSQEKNNSGSISARNPVDVLDNSSDEITDKNNDGVEKTQEFAAVNGTSIEISFEDTLEDENGNDDDKIFAGLVAGDQVTGFSIDNSDSVKQYLNSLSDNEWDEGVIEKKSLHEGGMSDEGDVEWEEGFQDIELKSSSCPDELVRKGALEDIQEAIRQSLEDTMGRRSINEFHEDHVISKGAREMINEDENRVFVYEGGEGSEIGVSAADISQKTVAKGVLEEEANIQEAIIRSLEDTRNRRSMNDVHEDHAISKGARDMVNEDENRVFVYEAEEEGPETEADVSQPNSTNALESNSKELKSAEFIELNPDENNFKLLTQDAGGRGVLTGEALVASDALPEQNVSCMTEKHPLDTCSEGGNGHAGNKLVGSLIREVAHNSSSSALSSSFTDTRQMSQAALDDHSCSTAKLGKIYGVDSITDVDGTNELAKEKLYTDFSMEKEEIVRQSSFLDNNKDQEMMEGRLEDEMLFLDKEREELGSKQRKLERNSESVSNEMFAECQDLLQMFGIPYIIAPMEAEAQCAFMELSNLVDGVVTDDSDAFLFGARSVYKNIFDDRKYVETYFMKDIENELGLDREKLIHIALLLGSDYTEGISGIGIVNAIEVVNAFPGKDGLREFREWIESPDPNILGKLDVESGGNLRRKGSKGNGNITSGSSGNVKGFSCDQHDDAERVKQIFMDKHRNVSKNWHISSSFPSDAVISAYAFPQVDKSTEPLSWGKPDLLVLRKLCWEKFGWGSSKADELLLPVLKEYNKHETQLRLEAFYTFNERFAKIRSKRIKKAVKEITKHKSSELMDETTTQQPASGKKRKVMPFGDETDQSGVVSAGLDDTMDKPTVKQLKRGRTKGKTSQINLEESSSVVRDVIAGTESRTRGKRRGQTSGRGRRKNNSSHGDTEIHSSESDEEMQFDESEESCRVRRSGRLRKTVNYNVYDESDDSDKESDENRPKECSMAEESFVDQTVNEVDKEESDVGIGERDCFEDTEETDTTDNNTSVNLIDGNKMDNTSVNLIDGNKMDELLEESQLLKDYDLQFGGGFCVDEEDEEMETNERHASSPRTESSPEKSDGLNLGDSLVEENPSTVTLRSSNDSGNRYSKSLRSMPNLRKKKKRN